MQANAHRPAARGGGRRVERAAGASRHSEGHTRRKDPDMVVYDAISSHPMAPRRAANAGGRATRDEGKPKMCVPGDGACGPARAQQRRSAAPGRKGRRPGPFGLSVPRPHPIQTEPARGQPPRRPFSSAEPTSTRRRPTRAAATTPIVKNASATRVAVRRPMAAREAKRAQVGRGSATTIRSDAPAAGRESTGLRAQGSGDSTGGWGPSASGSPADASPVTGDHVGADRRATRIRAA